MGVVAHMYMYMPGIAGPIIRVNFFMHMICTQYDHLQDLYLDRLTSQIASLEEQLALNDAQYSAQTQETKAVKENLTEANMELEVHVHTYMYMCCHSSSHRPTWN